MTPDTVPATNWQDTVDSLSTRLTTGAADTPPHSRIVTGLTALIDTALEHTHPTWTPGTPCPNCDSQILGLTQTFTELSIYYDTGGAKAKHGQYGHRLAWSCDKCTTPLQVSPLVLLASHTLFPDPPDTTAALTRTLDARAPATDWEPGTECVHCPRTDTRRTLVKTTPTTHHDDEYTLNHGSEPSELLCETCNGCETVLHHSPGGTLLTHSGGSLTLSA